MHWILLYVAIVFEVAGTTTLKLSHGLERLGFFALCLASYGISFGLLALALKTIPVGVAYAIWSGFGTLLIVIIGIVWFAEAATAPRLLFIAMIIIGAIGLNLTTQSH